MSLSRHPAISSVEPRVGSVNSFDGTRILYDLYPADSGKLVLVVPGFWRSRAHASMDQVARLLHHLGYAVAIVDVRGHGESDGTYGFNLDEHEDVYAVARHLTNSREVDAISLLGFSVGGSIAVCTAAKHPDIPWSSLLLVSPVAKFSMIRPRLSPFTMHRHLSASNALRPPRFTWRFLTSRKLCAADEIANVHLPVSLIHLKRDWLVDHRHSMLLFERANEPREMHIIDLPGRYHADRILGVAAGRIEPLIAEFLERTLRK